MPPLTYRITILGCRTNHAEARDMESVLLRRGFAKAEPGAPADLEIVHSCSVTSPAAAKSRQALRRAARRQRGSSSPGPRVSDASVGQCQASIDPPPNMGPGLILTGCYAATQSREPAAFTDSGPIILPHESEDGRSLLDRFTNEVDRFLSRRPSYPPIRPPCDGSSKGSITRLPAIDPHPAAGSHLRAELRVQDGCDAWCTYCIIPRIRRTMRSKPIVDAAFEARKLVDLGHKEIVLSGIFLGAYGHETAIRKRQRAGIHPPLAELIDAVANVAGIRRVRMSSLEPGDVTCELLQAIVANRPVVVPHLHLPLQSGSDRILKMMNRQYRVGEYLEMIEMVNEALKLPPIPTPAAIDGSLISDIGELQDRSALPPAITTDIICGFPGETEEEFESTFEVARQVGYLHMHVFPFSPRAGTAAARWGNRFVDERTRKDRVRALIDLENDPSQGLSITYRRGLLDRTVRVIIEQPAPDGGGLMIGRCDHYALIHVATDLPRGSLVEVTVTEVSPMRTSGEPAPAVEEPAISGG